MNYGVDLMVFHLQEILMINKLTRFFICADKKFAIIFLLFSFKVYGQTLSEYSVLDSAEKYYPLIKAEIAKIKKANFEYLSAKGKFDPQISSQLITSPSGIYKNIYSDTKLNIPIENTGNNLFVGYRIGQGNFPVYDQMRETYEYGEVNVGLELPLLRDKYIDSRRAKIQEANFIANLSEQDFKLMKLETKQQSSIAYWDWYVEGKKFLVRTKLLWLAKIRQKAIETSVGSGDMPVIEAIDNKRLIAQREAVLEAQNATFKKSAILLSLFYRNESGLPIIPKLNQIPNFELTLKENEINHSLIKNENLTGLVDQHPLIEKLNIQHNLAMVYLFSARNKLLPKLTNRIYLAQDFGPGDFSTNLPSLNRTSINYQIIFEYPIFQREAKGEIYAANQLIKKISQEKIMQHDQLVVTIQNTLIQINTQKFIIKNAFKEIQMALKLREAEKFKLKVGDGSLFLVNQREIDVAQAEERYFDAVGNYYKALAQLKFLLEPIQNIARLSEKTLIE